MTNSLVSLNDLTFKTVKTNAKGVETTVERGIVGVLTSGSKANRVEAAGHEISRYIANGMFRPLAREVVRVFGPSIIEVGSVVGLSMVTGTVDAESGLTNRQAWGRLFSVINRRNSEKPFKGEKAVYLTMINAAAMAYDKAQEERDLQRAANLGENVVDAVSTTEIETTATAE